MKRNNKAKHKKILQSHVWLFNENESLNQNFVKLIIEWVSNHFPNPFKRYILSLISVIGIFLSKTIIILSQLSLSVFLIEGNEKHSNKKIIILFIGKNHSSPYFFKLLFSEIVSRRSVGKIFIWNIKRKIESLSNEVNMIVVDCDKYYSSYLQRMGFGIIPEWVTMTLDINDPYDKIAMKFSKSALEDIRKIKRYCYTYEICDELEKLELFYYKMYLPYTRWRFGNLSICANFTAIRLLFEKDSKLMMIKHNDEYIFGSLFSVKNKKIKATYAGAMEGKFEYLKNSASAAAYYFLICWAKEHDINHLDFGKCRPFLYDGLFQYKKKWGTTISKSNSLYDSVLAINIKDKSDPIISFLINNPFIYLKNNTLKSMIYNYKDNESNKIEQYLTEHHMHNLNNFEITSIDKLTKNKNT